MTRLLQFSSTYGDDKRTVVYWRALEPNDPRAQTLADEFNTFDVDRELDAYNDACGTGRAGKVKTEVEEIDI